MFHLLLHKSINSCNLEGRKQTAYKWLVTIKSTEELSRQQVISFQYSEFLSQAQ